MWAKAQPYAEAAAQTWAGWAMQCAVRCYEGMKDWERAELWVRRLSERYPDSSLRAWLNFCKRTGHGDHRGGAGPGRSSSVRKPATRARGRRLRPSPPTPWRPAMPPGCKGPRKEAMDNMRKAYESDEPAAGWLRPAGAWRMS